MDIITFGDIKVTYGCIYVYRNKLNGKCSLGGKLTGRMIWVQNGIETRRCLPEDLDFYVSIGYKRGRKIS